MRSVIDRLAGLYDLQLGLERRAIHAALEMLAPQPEDRLLDLGTGTGAVLRALEQWPERPAEVIGLDRSRRMLARAEQHAAADALIEGDATTLPFPGARFTAVTVVYVLHLLEPSDTAHAVAEIKRVTRPGGRVAVVVPTLPAGALREPYRLIVRGLSRLSPAALGLRPIDPCSLLARHGLTVRRVRYIPLGYPSLCALAEA